MCTPQSGACCPPCSKHLYPCFPSVTVLSGHSPQLNRPGSDSDRHRTPRKQGSPRHALVGFPQNFPLKPFGHRQPTTWEERTVTRQAGPTSCIIRWKSVRQVRGGPSHLEAPLPVVLHHAVILADSSVEAAADTQDGAEQGARELVAHFDGQLDGLRVEQRPCQEAVTWGERSHGSWHDAAFKHVLPEFVSLHHRGHIVSP